MTRPDCPEVAATLAPFTIGEDGTVTINRTVKELEAIAGESFPGPGQTEIALALAVARLQERLCVSSEVISEQLEKVDDVLIDLNKLGRNDPVMEARATALQDALDALHNRAPRV